MKKFCSAAITALFIVLASSCGNNTSAPDTASSAPGAPATESGEAIFKRTCISCHQANGMGIPNTYPPLAKSDFLADKDKTIKQVIKGYTGELVVNGVKYNSAMPAQTLSDDEVAAVLTYLNTNFGNGLPGVSTSEVKAVRASL